MRTKLTTLTALLFLVAACGGEPAESSQTTGTNQATGTTAPSGQSPGDEGSPNDQELPFESGDGHFTVDGQRVEAVWVISCILDEGIFGDAPHEEALDVLARGDIGGREVFLGVTVDLRDVGSSDPDSEGYTPVSIDVFYSRSGPTEQFEGGVVQHPDGSWYLLGDLVPELAIRGQGITGDPIAGADFVTGPRRVAGTATLEQSWPEDADGTVVVSFDLNLPSERFDCTL